MWTDFLLLYLYPPTACPLSRGNHRVLPFSPHPFHRPEGDDTAACYGPYLSPEVVHGIREGTVLDVLCRDGMNYCAVVVSNSEGESSLLHQPTDSSPAAGAGHLHFLHWPKRFDFKGALSQLYLAKKGTYTAEIDGSNSYTLGQVEMRRQLNERLLASRRPRKLLSSTRYEEDFLSKPRMRFGRREGRRSKERLSSDPDSDATDERAAQGEEPSSSGRAEVREESAVSSSGPKKDKRVRVSRREPSTTEGVTHPESSEADPSFTIIEDSQPAVSGGSQVVPVDLDTELRDESDCPGELRQKLVVIDTQLARLREARRQIDSAISTLERMRTRYESIAKPES